MSDNNEDDNDEDRTISSLSLHLLFGSIAIATIDYCYESYNKVDCVQEYKHEFAKHGIIWLIQQDQSTYVVFTELSENQRILAKG